MIEAAINFESQKRFSKKLVHPVDSFDLIDLHNYMLKVSFLLQGCM